MVEQTTISLAVSLAIIFIPNGVSGSSCPAHVTKIHRGYTAVHNRVCYLFVNNELYWKKAREKCWELGGEMLIIENHETMEFIKGKLNSPEMAWDREGVWLGASKIDNKWKWTNGKFVNYSNWASGQPSSILGSMSVENCMQMRQDDGWKWHDIVCGAFSFHYNYVCQFPLNSPGDVAGRVSSSAADQTKDNGNSSILAIIIGISASLLIIMGIVFLVLHIQYRRRKQKASETTVHFINNTYSRPTPGPMFPERGAPAVPTSQVPFSSHLGPYLPNKETHRPEAHFCDGGQVTKSCNCGHGQAEAAEYLCSSPSSGSELGACGGIDPEFEAKVPLITTTRKMNCELVRASELTGGSQHSCSSISQGDYIDMTSLNAEQGKGDRVKDEDKHLYSNVDNRDSGIENIYEPLP